MGAIGLDVRLWFGALALSTTVWVSALAVDAMTEEASGPPTASKRVFASAPVFSPDGARIAFTCKGIGGYGACVMSADGGESTRLAQIEGYPDARPAFTPDGRIAFIGRHGGLDAVYVIGADGGSSEALLVDLGDRSTYPAFPAVGERLAFVSLLEEGSYVHVIDMDGTDRRRVGPLDAYEPAFSPDGTTIAFVRSVTQGGDGHYELAVMKVDGSGQRRLTDDAGKDDHHPTFAPDGRTIAFDRSDDGAEPGVFVVDTDSAKERRLVADGTEPAYSPDGRRVAFVRDAELWVIDVDGTDEKRLTEPEGDGP